MAIFREPAILPPVLLPHARVVNADAVMDETDEQQHAVSLIMTLGRVLLSLGSPAHRVESSLELMAQRLGLSAQFFCAPTALFIAVNQHVKGRQDAAASEQQRTYLVRVSAVGTDLGKIAEIAEVLSALERKTLAPDAAAAEVQAIYECPPRYGRGLSLLAFLMVSLPATLLLGGSVREMPLAALLGALVGLLAVFTQDRALGRLLVPLSASLTAFVATVWCGIDQHTALMPALTAGMIVLLPGLDLTTATRELATGHLVSGGARLAATGLVFATLAFGLALGGAVGQLLVGAVPPVQPQALPLELVTLSLLLAAIGLALILRVRIRQWPWVLLVCAVAWASAQLASGPLGSSLAAFVGGVLVGLCGNAYARLSGLPGSTLHIPGLLLLVPGSIGLRSMAALLGADVLMGIEAAFSAVLTAVALATGMISASVILPPRVEL